jgi:hypothetical protein
MNDSMEAENSISPIRPHAQGAPAMEGVEGATSSPNPQLDQDHGSNNSWYEYPDVSGIQADTSGVETQAQGDTTAEMNDKEEGDAKSETSSVMFDYDVDPEGFARRLDELAGTLEVGEEEARALRWGPAIGKEGNGACLQVSSISKGDLLIVDPPLSITDFKTLVNHHLDTTEWRYAQNSDDMMDVRGATTGGRMASHPIKVLGPTRGAVSGLGHTGP